MTKKATHGEVLDALLCVWLIVADEPKRTRKVAWVLHAALDAGAHYHVASTAEATNTRTWDCTDSLFVPGGCDAPAEMRLLRAIAAEEAADRLETARAALLDAATEVASLIDPRWPHHSLRGQHPALMTLYDANDEWQEVQLQAYSPHEASGLVGVSDG